MSTTWRILQVVFYREVLPSDVQQALDGAHGWSLGQVRADVRRGCMCPPINGVTPCTKPQCADARTLRIEIIHEPPTEGASL